MRGKIRGVTGGKEGTEVTLSLFIAPAAVEKYIGKDVDIEIGYHRKKRSITANAYAWVLMDKIAEKTSVPVSTVYKEMVREVGGNTSIVSVSDEAVNTFCSAWGKNGLGWQTDIIGEQDGMTDIMVYYGTSTFDTRQMTRLIEAIIAECKLFDIETMTPRELEVLLAKHH